MDNYFKKLQTSVNLTNSKTSSKKLKLVNNKQKSSFSCQKSNNIKNPNATLYHDYTQKVNIDLDSIQSNHKMNNKRHFDVQDNKEATILSPNTSLTTAYYTQGLTSPLIGQSQMFSKRISLENNSTSQANKMGLHENFILISNGEKLNIDRITNQQNQEQQQSQQKSSAINTIRNNQHSAIVLQPENGSYQTHLTFDDQNKPVYIIHQSNQQIQQQYDQNFIEKPTLQKFPQNSDNQQTLKQQLIMKELEIEVLELRNQNENLEKQLKVRDKEISILQVEKQQIQEEKQFLKDQISTITNKAKESMNFAASMAMMCEKLQLKLQDKNFQEQSTYQQLERLISQYQKSTEYIVDSRIQVESQQIQMKSLEGQLTESQERNLMLTIELNRLLNEKRNDGDKDIEIENLKKEATSLNVELSLAKHQYNNMRFKMQDLEDKLRQQNRIVTSQIDSPFLDSNMNINQQRNGGLLERPQSEDSNQIRLSGNLISDSFGSTTHDETNLYI